MKILVACEESQAVTKAFRKRGHEAYSADLLECSGGHPEWHLQGDVLPLLKLEGWDMILAFPPCTDLAASGAPWFAKKRADGRQQRSIDFFMEFTKVSCPRVCIENPVGIMSNVWRKPDQVINPWQFGHEVRKRTCLWLKGLPKLEPTHVVGKGEQVVYESGCVVSKWHADTWLLPYKERGKVRSKTFQGIADAMAQQWG